MTAESSFRRGSLTRDLSIWLGCFVMAALALVVYLHAPLVPLLFAGGLTLALTALRHFTQKK